MRQARTTPTPQQPPLDWLLVANSARARLFERDADNGALREVSGAVHPASRAHEATLGHDRPGHVFKGAASTAFEPHTAPHTREQAQFAHALAQMLEQAALEHRTMGLVLMASNPFLGVLRSALGPAARAILKVSLPVDLTQLNDAELEHRVRETLAGRGGTAAASASHGA